MKTRLLPSIFLTGCLLLLATVTLPAQEADAPANDKIIELRRFDQIKISPLIDVVLVEGESESIEIIDSKANPERP
ncbi:MAG: hypothetical protein AAFO94_15850 [Bacteroidota bacterium]